jgi:serine/threonine protein kinase
MTGDPQKPSDPDTASFDEQAINRARDILKSAPEPFKAAPETVGAYRILEKLGQGGMGEVYRAEQRSPIRREVALKLIKLGMDTKQVIARFSAERQALAMMDHPNIAKVFDAGTDETGRPYFVMEYVKGKPITEYADEKQLSLDDRLKLFEQVCHAIQHAHHKGVIHRDLKPSNVLVSTQDGRPHAKVIDFGIAKAMNQPLTDMTLFTEHALMVGTPAYMSPEQAEGNIDIDTRSDVYSLGVLLYELLTGHTPFDPQRLRKAAIMEVARILRDEEPPKPSTRISAIDNIAPRSSMEASSPQTTTSSKTNTSKLASLAKARNLAPESYAKHLRGELDWIVMKALEKDRTRRYTTPADFAEDIQRHLEGVPIEAAPPDIKYRTQKFMRNHWRPVVAGATTVAALLVFTVVISLMALKLREQVKIAQSALIDAKESQQNEARQRVKAETNRAAADRAANRAMYEAARNKSQYLVEQKLFDKALLSAFDAYKLNGGWEDGLLVNGIVNRCRQDWDVELDVGFDKRPTSAAIAGQEESKSVFVVSGLELFRYSLETGLLLKKTNLARAPKKLLPFRHNSDFIAVVYDRSITVHSIQDISKYSEVAFGKEEIVESAASQNKIVVTLSNKDIQVFDFSLKNQATVKFPDEAKLKNGQSLRKLAISPNGRYVIASGATWQNDCMIWNLDSAETKLRQLTASVVHFDSDTSMLGAVTGVDTNGIACHRFTLLENGEIEESFLADIPGEDIGGQRYLGSDSTGFVIAGAIGVATAINSTNKNGPAQLNVQRYTSIIGVPTKGDLYALSITEDSNYLLLACDDKLLVLRRNRGSTRSLGLGKGMNSAIGRNGLYRVGMTKEFLQLYVEPYGQRGQGSTARLSRPSAPIDGWRTIPCGITISEDQSTLAVRYADAESRMNAGEKVRNHGVAIYRLSSNKATESIGDSVNVMFRLDCQDESAESACRRPSNRLLELSPDGKFVLIGSRQNGISRGELYNARTGELIRSWPSNLDTLGPNPLATYDTSTFVDVGREGRSLRLIGWASGDVIAEHQVSGDIDWICRDNVSSRIICSLRDKRIVQIDLATGKSVGEISSNQIALSYVSGSDVFLAFDGSSLSNSRRSLGQGNLVLADTKTGDVRTILMKSHNLGCLAKFSDDGKTVLCSGYGWDVEDTEISQNLSPELAIKRLQSSRLDSPSPQVTVQSPSSINILAVDNQKKETDSTTKTSGTVFIATPIQDIRDSVGSEKSIVFRVASTGGNSNLFLNSLIDYKSSNCFATKVTTKAVAQFASVGYLNPKRDLIGKKIEVRGVVEIVDGRLQVVVTDLQKQLSVQAD